jgi:hypothetical protein
MTKIVKIATIVTPQIISMIAMNRIRKIANSIFKNFLKYNTATLCYKIYALAFAMFEDKAEILAFACPEIACCYRVCGGFC